MQMLVARSVRWRKAAMKTLLAAACGVGLMLSSAVDYAQAQKAEGSRPRRQGLANLRPTRSCATTPSLVAPVGRLMCHAGLLGESPAPVTRRCNSRVWGGAPGASAATTGSSIAWLRADLGPSGLDRAGASRQQR